MVLLNGCFTFLVFSMCYILQLFFKCCDAYVFVGEGVSSLLREVLEPPILFPEMIIFCLDLSKLSF